RQQQQSRRRRRGPVLRRSHAGGPRPPVRLLTSVARPRSFVVARPQTLHLSGGCPTVSGQGGRSAVRGRKPVKVTSSASEMAPGQSGVAPSGSRQLFHSHASGGTL